MRLGILGPLLVVDDTGRQIPVTAARQRVLLAALLARANRIVPVDELAELVWDGAPPAGAARTLRSYAVRLRHAVGPQIADRIETRDPGYLCRIGENDEVDELRFEALCRTARAALRPGAWAQAVDTAAQALALWRDEPLRDVPSLVLREQVVPRLEQLRAQVLEDRAEAGLHLGRQEQLVPELCDLVAAHPLRERFRAQLMLALACCGRRAEALEAYRDARRVLVDELGVEPGPELRTLHEKILAGETVLIASASPGASPGVPPTQVPRQLPAAVAHFAGRATQLKTLAGLPARAGQGAGTVVISAIGGTAGVGKTALALHWAHQAAGRFPDGQLYVNLRGFDASGSPLDAAVAVRRFLDALAVPAARIPADPDAQVDLYRSVLADRRMLIVLDNARDAGQVRPLLPGAAGCLVLVTSRNRMTDLVALDGAIPLALDLLTPGEAGELLARRLGAERVAREQQAAGELIELCARLPLALNIAAARAAVHPDTPLGALAGQLRDAHRRLDVLSAGGGGADLRAVFCWSYRALSTTAARLFRLLSLHPGPDIDLSAAASLAALPGDATRRALDELACAHLVTEPVPGRYALHDLLRAFAAEQADHRDSEAERREALHRVLDHYLHTAHPAAHLLCPGQLPSPAAPRPGVAPESFADRDHAVGWFDRELTVLGAIVAHAAAAGFDTHAWQIPRALMGYLEHCGRTHEQLDIAAIALPAAERAGDPGAQADAHRWLGAALAACGSCQQAQTHLARALDLFGTVGDGNGQGNVHNVLAGLRERQHRYADALAHAEHALDLHRTADHAQGQARSLSAVARYQALLGQYQRALASSETALELTRQIGNAHREVVVLDTLGYIYQHVGRPAAAAAYYQQAQCLAEAVGALAPCAGALTGLGDARHALGDTPAARDAWQRALAILDDLKHPGAEHVRTKINNLGMR